MMMIIIHCIIPISIFLDMEGLTQCSMERKEKIWGEPIIPQDCILYQNSCQSPSLDPLSEEESTKQKGNR